MNKTRHCDICGGEMVLERSGPGQYYECPRCEYRRSVEVAYKKRMEQIFNDIQTIAAKQYDNKNKDEN